MFDSDGKDEDGYHDRKFAFHCRGTDLQIDTNEEPVWFDKDAEGHEFGHPGYTIDFKV